MANPGDTGGGATITLATSGFTGSYRRIGSVKKVRPDVSVSHLAASNELYRPGDAVENGETPCEFLWNPASTPPSITADPETITITYPKRLAASSAAATLAGTGFLKEVEHPEFQLNQACIGKYTIKWDGETPPTYTPEA